MIRMERLCDRPDFGAVFQFRIRFNGFNSSINHLEANEIEKMTTNRINVKDDSCRDCGLLDKRINTFDIHYHTISNIW